MCIRDRVLLDVLEEFDLVGERIPGFTGIWLEGRKVAAIGTGCRRWITQHGLALNVSCALSGFELITPCGLRDSRVGRLCDWRPGLTVEQVQPRLREALCRRFDLVWSAEA